MADLSHLDKKYFVDPHKYNCPFCKRNSVSYSFVEHRTFDWTDKKTCHVYYIRCESSGCGKVSLHFSFEDLRATDNIHAGLNETKRIYFNRFKGGVDIDSKLFYSQPTSYFILDSRIPEKIRALVSEAENSRKANFLVGASASIRKAIYELLKHEKVTVENEKTGRTNYQASIEELNQKFSKIEPTYFNNLGNILHMVSDQVHEDSWDKWDSDKLLFIIELTKTILYEIYVFPAERQKESDSLNQMKSAFSDSKNQIADKSGKSD